MLTSEQIIASNRTQAETLFGLTNQAFASIEKLVELNLTAARAALAETANQAQTTLNAKDPQEFLALQASLLQPLMEKATAYSRHVYDITSGSTAEFGRVFEEQTSEAQRKMISAVESIAKNAPAGSEPAVAFIRSAVSTATNTFDTIQKSVRQATEIAEANLNAVTNTAVNAAKTTANATARKR